MTDQPEKPPVAESPKTDDKPKTNNAVPAEKADSATAKTDSQPVTDEKEPDVSSESAKPDSPEVIKGATPPAEAKTAPLSNQQPVKEPAPPAETKPAPSTPVMPSPVTPAPVKAAETVLNAPVTKRIEAPDDVVEKSTSPVPPSSATPVIQLDSNKPLISDKDDTLVPGTQPTTTGMICPTCGHRNRVGILICDNCGTTLVGGVKSSVATRDLTDVSDEKSATGQPVLDTEQAKAVETAGTWNFTDDMVLRIEIEGGSTPMLVYPKQEIIIGRRDPNTGTLPDVDLTAYAGYRMGVSRRHASIRLQDRQLNLSDLGSSNGTFLNGTRLIGHRPYQLRDGDEIRVGQMVVKVFFQVNKKKNTGNLNS